MKTIALYQFPEAIHEIVRWAQERGMQLDSDTNFWAFDIDCINGIESFEILPIDQLTDSMDCTKLVVYGAVTRKDLIRISTLINIKE